MFGQAGGRPGNQASLVANFWQNLVASAMGLPGVLLAIAMLRPMGSKRLQGWGFVAIAVASMAFAASLYVAVDKWTSFALTCLLVFAINWGVNVTSYVLPAEAFPTAVRSSFFGCSACLGKLGALLGTYTFGPIAAMGAHGITWVFVVCAAVSLVGVGVTHAFVEPYGHGTSHLWLGFGYG